jgi:hypothetical protein
MAIDVPAVHKLIVLVYKFINAPVKKTPRWIPVIKNIVPDV